MFQEIEVNEPVRDFIGENKNDLSEQFRSEALDLFGKQTGGLKAEKNNQHLPELFLCGGEKGEFGAPDAARPESISARVEKLIDKLGSMQERELKDASSELKKLGVDALERLVKASLEAESPAVRKRAKELVKKIVSPSVESAGEIDRDCEVPHPTNPDFWYVDPHTAGPRYQKRAEKLEDYSRKPEKLKKRLNEIDRMVKLIDKTRLGLTPDEARKAKEHLEKELADLKNPEKEAEKAWDLSANLHDWGEEPDSDQEPEWEY